MIRPHRINLHNSTQSFGGKRSSRIGEKITRRSVYEYVESTTAFIDGEFDCVRTSLGVTYVAYLIEDSFGCSIRCGGVVGLGGEEGLGGGGEEGTPSTEDDCGGAAVGKELVAYLVADSGCTACY